MKRRFAVIGLGTFGFQLASELERSGAEVLAIDLDADVVQEIRDRVTRAVVCDALDRESLQEVGAGDVDVVVIAIPKELDVSILTTMYVQELGVDEVIVQAISEDHRRALERLGASRIIFPEKDMAIRVAGHLMAPNLVDYVYVGRGYGLVEVRTPASFVEKTLLDLNLRREYGVTLVAVRSRVKAEEDAKRAKEAMPADTEARTFVPEPDYTFHEGDILILVGKDDDLKKFPEK